MQIQTATTTVLVLLAATTPSAAAFHAATGPSIIASRVSEPRMQLPSLPKNLPSLSTALTALITVQSIDQLRSDIPGLFGPSPNYFSALINSTSQNLDAFSQQLG